MGSLGYIDLLLGFFVRYIVALFKGHLGFWVLGLGV